MFETAIVDARGGRGVMSFSSSLLLQCGLVGTGFMVSLWMPVALPDTPDLLVSLPAPRSQKVIRIVSAAVERGFSATPAVRRLSYAPPTQSRNPVAREMLMEDPGLFAQTSNYGSGPGRNEVMDSLPALPPPQAQKAVPQEAQKPVVPQRLQVGGDVLASKLIHRVQPSYPELARRSRVQGVVQLHGLITREGRIANLRVLSGHPLLVKAALDAVSQWLYTPTLLNQQPVEVEAPIEVRFTLAQ